MKPTPAKLLRAAGLLTAALAAFPSAGRFVRAPSVDALAWIAPLIVFIGAFLVALREQAPMRMRRAALAVESMSALAFAGFARGGFSAALTAVVAGQAPLLVGGRASLALVGAQTLALAGIFGQGSGPLEGLVGSGGYLGFQLFALGAAYLAQREADARAELARANAELLATRELFADATRTTERLRIARDLHDAIGHNLTALRLQLEVARNADGVKQHAALERSSAVAKSLLDEVREVVSTMREDQPIDLARALSHLVESVPRPKVTLAIEPDVSVADPALAHAIFRFAQEAITNAARHAGAENLRIEVTMEGERVRVSARDDGRAPPEVREGNGLRGLRERLERLGGTLEVATANGRGVELLALVPVRGGPP